MHKPFIPCKCERGGKWKSSYRCTDCTNVVCECTDGASARAETNREKHMAQEKRNKDSTRPATERHTHGECNVYSIAQHANIPQAIDKQTPRREGF